MSPRKPCLVTTKIKKEKMIPEEIAIEAEAGTKGSTTEAHLEAGSEMKTEVSVEMDVENQEAEEKEAVSTTRMEKAQVKEDPKELTKLKR